MTFEEFKKMELERPPEWMLRVKWIAHQTVWYGLIVCGVLEIIHWMVK